MEVPMGSPVLQGFSLRVQLFAPNAYARDDKPIRCFRVVTNPEATIKEFCQEASRIHEINYGIPLAIKKCQDDEEFDITQSDILGNLFEKTATIRIIQASAYPSIRDSVPPTSALRFDPANPIYRKRDRENSARTNVISPLSSWTPNKRQRVSDLDPDHLLPSRESQEEAESHNGRPEDSTVPNSQGSVILGRNGGSFSTSRHVKPALPQIPETPTPSPPPEKSGTDHQGHKHVNHRSSLPAEIREYSPFRESSGRAKSPLSNPQARSASYHIQRATEKGTSVSTTAKSPISRQQAAQNGVLSSNRRKTSDSTASSRMSSGSQNRSLNENSIYENIVSDDESGAILRKKRAALKIRNSPNSGLHGLEWASNKFNTPPSGRHRSREQATAASELPLTPNSKGLEERQRQKEADEARIARLAAAEAAEQRKREADEARQSEEARLEAKESYQREEQEQAETEEFRRGEAKRAAVTAEASLKKGVEEEKMRREQDIIIKEAKDEKAKRLREEEEEKAKHEANAEGPKNRKDEVEAPMRISSSPQEDLREPTLSIPILPRSTSIRPPSSTKFFPARKSVLRSSSQAVRSSSPAESKLSIEVPLKGVGIEAQMPLPSLASRRVSFEKPPRLATPIRPITRVLPPKTATPKGIMHHSATKPAAKLTILPPGKLSTTPILPPITVKRNSQERNMTPHVQTNIQSLTRKEESSLFTKKITPPLPKRISPPAHASSRKPETASETPATKEKSKSVEESEIPGSLSDSSESAYQKEGEDKNEKRNVPSREAIPSKSGPPRIHSRTIKVADLEYEEDIPKTFSPLDLVRRIPTRSSLKKLAESGNEDEKSGEEKEVPRKASPPNLARRTQSRSPVRISAESDDEDGPETASQNSGRNSRSPVVFSQHSQATKSAKRKLSASLESEDDQASGSNNDTTIPDAKEEESESGSDYSESNATDKDKDIKIEVPKSSQVLPPPKPVLRVSTLKNTVSNQSMSKAQIVDSDLSTQEEIDNQLTSSMYEVSTPAPPISTPIPAPNSTDSVRKIGYGASLSSLNEKMNEKKPAKTGFTSSAGALSSTNGIARAQLKLQEDEESSEESDDESNDDSSSDEEETKKPATPSANSPRPSRNQFVYDSSDSDTDSESESEDQVTKARNELAAQIQRMNSGQKTQIDLPSPRPYPSTQDIHLSKKDSEKRGKQDKYITGYSFSQPT